MLPIKCSNINIINRFIRNLDHATILIIHMKSTRLLFIRRISEHLNVKSTISKHTYTSNDMFSSQAEYSKAIEQKTLEYSMPYCVWLEAPKLIIKR